MYGPLPLILGTNPHPGMTYPIHVCAWCSVEKSNIIQKLAQVNKVAITWDGCTSVAQDTGHFHTVTVHYIYKGKMKQNMLSTEVVYESQTGPIVAKEIASTVEQFRLGEKIIAATRERQHHECCFEKFRCFKKWDSLLTPSN